VLHDGNMTSRSEYGVIYTQVFDAENRLVSVTVGEGEEAETTEFVYNGDGDWTAKIYPDLYSFLLRASPCGFSLYISV
jgi:hypothetical protein